MRSVHSETIEILSTGPTTYKVSRGGLPIGGVELKDGKAWLTGPGLGAFWKEPFRDKEEAVIHLLRAHFGASSLFQTRAAEQEHARKTKVESE